MLMSEKSYIYCFTVFLLTASLKLILRFQASRRVCRFLLTWPDGRGLTARVRETGLALWSMIGADPAGIQQPSKKASYASVPLPH